MTADWYLLQRLYDAHCHDAPARPNSLRLPTYSGVNSIGGKRRSGCEQKGDGGGKLHFTLLLFVTTKASLLIKMAGFNIQGRYRIFFMRESCPGVIISNENRHNVRRNLTSQWRSHSYEPGTLSWHEERTERSKMMIHGLQIRHRSSHDSAWYAHIRIRGNKLRGESKFILGDQMRFHWYFLEYPQIRTFATKKFVRTELVESWVVVLLLREIRSDGFDAGEQDDK